jgi:hypothetical protein
VRRAGLGLLVGAVLHAVAAFDLGAQVPSRDTTRAPRPPRDTTVAAVPARPDSVRVDSNATAARRDTAQARGDTIKPPLARAESPVLTDVGSSFRWNRPAMFASGALTLADLLERVPGLVTLRARWLPSPMVGAYLGDPGGVRIFVDGMELDVLDARDGGIQDLSRIQLWTLEEVAIERGASEVRVYLRTWRTDRTDAYTRTDVATGDEDTNMYRMFYGKRFRHGEALQIAAQQYSTEGTRFGGDGDALSLLARAGIARRGWSLDGFINRTRRSRAELLPLESNTARPIAALDATDVQAYVRAGSGDPERGPWVQVLAGNLQFREVGNQVDSTQDGPDRPLNVLDTITSRAQYVGAAGLTRGPFRVSATARYRVFAGRRDLSPSGRVGFDRQRVAVSLFAERSSLDERTRLEASARLLPLPFLALAGAVSRTSEGAPQQFVFVADSASDTLTIRAPETMAARAEASIRVGRLWLGGGLLVRDTALLQPPVVFDRDYAPTVDSRAVGTFASVQGRIFKAIHADATGVRWNESDTFYRPQYQSRARLFVSTEWRSRFPSGNFSLLAAGTHEYRSAAIFPLADGTAFATPQSRVVSSLLEIRIVNAVLTWQFRNILGERYQTVPGFEMPRPTSVYGVRWEFWN